MKQFRSQHPSILAIPRFSPPFVTVAAVLAFLLAAPPVAIGQVATGSAAQAETSGGQTGAVPAAGTSEGANAQVAGSSFSTSSTDAGTAEVSFQDGLLSVSAERADLVGLLEKISKAAGVPIEIREGVSGSVTIFFARLALEEGITRILDAAGSRNMLAAFDGAGAGSGGAGKLAKISVLRQASGAAAPRDPRRFGFETNREALKRYIEARYGKESLREDSVRRNTTHDTITFFSFYDPGVTSRVTEGNARQYAEEKIREFSTFLSLAPEQVAFQDHPRNGPLSFEVRYQQVFASIPVENTFSGVQIYKEQTKPGRDLVHVSQAFHPSITVSTTPNITAEQAAQRGEEEHRRTYSAWNFMLDQKRYEDAETEFKTLRHPAELVILPQGIPERDPARYEYYLAYKIGYLPQTYYIDAQTGKVIRAISHVQHSSETMRRVP